MKKKIKHNITSPNPPHNNKQLHHHKDTETSWYCTKSKHVSVCHGELCAITSAAASGNWVLKPPCCCETHSQAHKPAHRQEEGRRAAQLKKQGRAKPFGTLLLVYVGTGGNLYRIQKVLLCSTVSHISQSTAPATEEWQEK